MAFLQKDGIPMGSSFTKVSTDRMRNDIPNNKKCNGFAFFKVKIEFDCNAAGIFKQCDQMARIFCRLKQ